MNEIIPYSEKSKMAEAIVTSGVFGYTHPGQVIAMFLIAESENKHIGSIFKEYHMQNMDGRVVPGLKAEAVQARFLQDGGSVEWNVYSEKEVDATFTAPNGKSLQHSLTFDAMVKRGIASKRDGTIKDNWKAHPAAMLRSRVITEAIRTLWPQVITGLYSPDEIDDIRFSRAKEMEDSKPYIYPSVSFNDRPPYAKDEILEILEEVNLLALELQIPSETINKWNEKAGVNSFDKYSWDQLSKVLEYLKKEKFSRISQQGESADE